MNVKLNLDRNQIGQSTITLTAAQLAAIHAQENAAPPASTPPASSATQRHDGAPPVRPPAYTAPSGGNPNGPTTYPVDAVKLADDAMYLYQMDLNYRHVLGHLPGAHQVHFDILTNGAGKRWSDGVPQPAGTVNDPALKQAINRVINWAGEENAAATVRFDVNAYNGPLKPIYANLVAAKLAGKA